ncbi:MAG: tRNA pseudouridine(55) synthase TruB [bacterium]|nr:tRNA pseudouridine(55) synthase TruB [bacterium]
MMVRDGFLLVDKPAGVTSFRIVDHVRRLLLTHDPSLQPARQRRRGGPRPPRYKCGHAGTLDPLATGLLVVMTGRATRLGPFLTGLDKTYAATVRCGEATDSLDADGVVVDRAPVPDDPAVFDAVLDRFRGDIQQAPPVVSALKRDGKPLHARVRAGEDVAEPAPRPVRIDRLEITASRWPDPDTGHHEIDLEADCSSGTYVRSLGRDLALAAGTVGHLTALRRLRVGPFQVADALSDVTGLAADEAAAAVRPAVAALPWTPLVRLDADEALAVRTGGQPAPAWAARLEGEEPGPDGLFRMLDADGRLLAVGHLDPEPRLAAVLAGPPAPQTEEDADPCA